MDYFLYYKAMKRQRSMRYNAGLCLTPNKMMDFVLCRFIRLTDSQTESLIQRIAIVRDNRIPVSPNMHLT
jgi:hypothetical protein